MVNDIKLEFLKMDGTLTRAALRCKIDKGAFSLITNRHRAPSEGERKKLLAALGRYRYRKLFGKSRAKIEGDAVVNE